MKRQDEKHDPFKKQREWLDHRYDPAHFTGGNIHPLLDSQYPNKYGYVLIFVGTFAAALQVFLSSYKGLVDLLLVLLGVAFALLAVVAGFKLIKKPPRTRVR